jgi:hypothetical protein
MQADSRLARRAWLFAIALGHLGLIVAWRPAARLDDAMAGRPESALVLLTLPAPVRPRPATLPPPPPRLKAAAPAMPPVAREAAAADAPPVAAEATPQSITLPAQASIPADPFATPAAAPADTLRDKLRKSAASVDRQLRKESLNKFATIVDEEKTAKLSVTGSHAGPAPAAQSFTGANGIVHKRYMLRGEMVCEEVDHIGVGGHDPFRNGSKARLVKCPK